ncbi:MAG TPA: histone deacetylase [Planctomycetaceae bacterium]|nr:histone deacetylase [Planctomycetaceae bacterium]
MLVYLDDDFAKHETGTHPECPARITRLNTLLRSSAGGLTFCEDWAPATAEEIGQVHDAAYIDQLERWCEEGPQQIESDTFVSSHSFRCTSKAAGAACDAVARVIAEETKAAFCAVRPPGHHALPNGPMGFCLFNSVAVAAQKALTLGLERVMIIDWDVHHGNGTQDAFYESEQIAFFSIHRSPFYPGTGATSETGTGFGLGTTLNVPVDADISKRDFTDAFTRGIEDLAAKHQPELILLSAGFDAHRLDPVGGLCLESEDFIGLTEIVQELSAAHCSGRIVSLLEGGYQLEHMPQSALAHVKTLSA